MASDENNVELESEEESEGELEIDDEEVDDDVSEDEDAAEDNDDDVDDDDEENEPISTDKAKVDDDDDDEENEPISTAKEKNAADSTQLKMKAQKCKIPGIVYLSKIPEGMTVRTFKEMMSRYGTTLRCYLEPDPQSKRKNGRKYIEGWIEFSDKKIAKRIALSLNCQRVGLHKRSKWYDELWNMKYLSKFKWFHLTERLDYEHAVREQKMRKELLQAKKETEFYLENVGKSKKMKKMEDKKKRKPDSVPKDKKPDRIFSYKLKQTENEILAKKTDSPKSFDPNKYVNPKSVKANTNFLKNIFSGGL